MLRNSYYIDARPYKDAEQGVGIRVKAFNEKRAIKKAMKRHKELKSNRYIEIKQLNTN